MAYEQTEFKFPDEVDPTAEVEAADDIEVELVDDTPPEDRGRKPLPQNVVEELDGDDLEEYSDKVKKRLGQMKKVWHDERRAKEAALREREEAIRFAQQAYQEAQQLRQRVGTGEKYLAEELTRSAQTEVGTAKEKLRQAYEQGDAELIANAQEALTDAKLKLKETQFFTPSLPEEENRVQTPQQVPAPRPVVDEKAENWRQRNQWFGVDEEMTALALGLHEKLVRSGVDPRSDDYYRRVDETIRKRFPEQFAEEEGQRGRSPARKQATSVVAPATRSSAPRQVRLTPSQVAIAKKLGLTNEAYARELMKLENQNG
jgi:hypothetical protein